MIEIKKLSNSDLEGRLKYLVARERKILHVILEHIVEVDRRKLYLEKAYSSMKDYLIKELGYSATCALARLDAARLLRDVPQMSEKIETGSINLSQACEVSRAIKEKERVSQAKVTAAVKSELISKIEGLTLKETQKNLALSLDITPKDYEKQRVQQDDSVRIELTLSKTQFEKLKQCQDIGAYELLRKELGLSSVIEFVCDQFLNKKMPSQKERAVSSEKMDLPQNSSVFPILDKSANDSKNQELESARSFNLKADVDLKDGSKPFNSSKNPTPAPSESVSCCDIKTQRQNKSITPKTRRLILNRDKCCQYKNPQTGKICGGSYYLEVDHSVPRWAGGSHSYDNLQLLCRNHNQFKYRQQSFISTTN